MEYTLAQFTELNLLSGLHKKTLLKLKVSIAMLQGMEEFCVSSFYGKIILTNNARI